MSRQNQTAAPKAAAIPGTAGAPGPSVRVEHFEVRRHGSVFTAKGVMLDRLTVILLITVVAILGSVALVLWLSDAGQGPATASRVFAG